MEIVRNHNSMTSNVKQKNSFPLQKQQERIQLEDFEKHLLKPSDYNELKKKVDGVNQFLKTTNTNIKFNLHEELNEYYITIIDQDTNEVIKEVPPKRMLDFYASMVEAFGIFIDKKI